MANRTGTYVAFDGLGQADPTKSDFRCYGTIQMWDANKAIDFSFVNSHEKTDAVRDTSKMATLKTRIQERLRASKNMIVLLSSQTRKSGSILSYEIELAVDTYKLPLIIAYVEFQVVLAPSLLSNYWPNSLGSRINNDQGNMIHIPFAKDPIMNALPRFTVNGEEIRGNKAHYDADAHRNWELLYPDSAEQNYIWPRKS
jgi:hypothetical protein